MLNWKSWSSLWNRTADEIGAAGAHVISYWSTLDLTSRMAQTAEVKFTSHKLHRYKKKIHTEFEDTIGRSSKFSLHHPEHLFLSLCFYSGYPRACSITVPKLNYPQQGELSICNKIAYTAKYALERITYLSARFWSPRLHFSFLQWSMLKSKTLHRQPYILVLHNFFVNCDCFCSPSLTNQTSLMMVPLEVCTFFSAITSNVLLGSSRKKKLLFQTKMINN